MVYQNGILASVLTEEGYVTLNGTTPTFHYDLKDHQGNNRVVINQNGTVEQVNHYYPFGALMAESSGQDLQPWKYGDKELDRTNGLDWYDFSARRMDPVLPGFKSVDPMAEKYYSLSPYTYCANNPVNAFDLNGDSIWYTTKNNVTTMHVTGKVFNQSGSNINVPRAASDIATNIKEAYSGSFDLNGQSYELQTDVQLQAATSMNEVASSDHLFVLANTDGKGARGITSIDGGKVMTISAGDFANNNWFSNTFSSNNTRTAVHELGHAAGLTHETASGWRNLMTQSRGGTNITSKQRQIMLLRQNTINLGPNSFLGQPYPYAHYLDNGQWYKVSVNKLLKRK